MASFKFVLRQSKQRADGTAPIYLRITESRKSRFMVTNIYIEPKHWNEARQEVRRSHSRSAVLNDNLKSLRNDVETTALQLKGGKRKSLSAEAVKKELMGQGASQFFPYAEAFAEKHNSEGRYWEWRKINVLITKLREFVEGRDLSLEEIDHRFVARFERYMREVKKNKTNTIGKNLQILHRIIKLAIKEGLFPAGENPFLHHQIKSERTTKEKLSVEDIQALEGLDLPRGSWLELTRDTFLFSFYNAGIRFGDVCRLKEKNINDGRLNYQMAKTGVWKSIKIPEPALGILSRYRKPEAKPEDFLFPLLEAGLDVSDPILVRKRISSMNVVVNKNLKKLAELAKIKSHLSFHVSRHSYADYARRKGLDLYVISKSLGHSKLNITQVYLEELDQEALDSAMDELFPSSLPGA